MVLIKLFPAEGPLKGILAIVCGLYAYVWGWMNSDALQPEERHDGLDRASADHASRPAAWAPFSAYSQATSGM